MGSEVMGTRDSGLGTRGFARGEPLTRATTPPFTPEPRTPSPESQ